MYSIIYFQKGISCVCRRLFIHTGCGLYPIKTIIYLSDDSFSIRSSVFFLSSDYFFCFNFGFSQFSWSNMNKSLTGVKLKTLLRKGPVCVFTRWNINVTLNFLSLLRVLTVSLSARLKVYAKKCTLVLISCNTCNILNTYRLYSYEVPRSQMYSFIHKYPSSSYDNIISLSVTCLFALVRQRQPLS